MKSSSIKPATDTVPLLVFTLVYLRRGGYTSFMRKKIKIGAGKYNGYGGKIEPGDASIEDACVRELNEESGKDNGLAGIIADKKDLRKVALILFHNKKENSDPFDALVHVFFLEQWHGEPRETDTMGPCEMFPDTMLPFTEMMPADQIWFPLVNQGKKIVGEAWYTPGQQALAQDMRIEEVDVVPEALPW